MKLLHIAIDGPVASGKGEIARRLAHELHILYIDTGAMYRAFALSCINAHVDTRNESAVVALLPETVIALSPAKNADEYITVTLGGVDVTYRIREPDVSKASSDVAVFKKVREWMVDAQQKLAVGQSVVMEGRDIGLRVLPDASIKIYLTASLEERARRRFRQWQEKGITRSYEETIEDTRVRDMQDTTRAVDPLQILDGAWVLDTTTLSRDDVLHAIITELTKRKLL